MRREYWESPEIYNVEVEVTKIDDKRITISPNIFHPEEGGQPADKGMVGEVVVESVVVVDGKIVLSLSKDISSGKYSVKVDKKHRLFTSRYHTAQHIISGIAEKEFDLKTVGVHIGDTSTIEFDKEVCWETINKIELLSNQVVMDDFSVNTSYGEGETRFHDVLEGMNPDDIRVVSIEDIDSSACCGAHVSKTGNIGFIKIISIEKKRTGSRITYVTGFDAVEYSQSETDVLRELRKQTSCSNSELLKKLSQMIIDTKEKNRELNALWIKMIPFITENCEVVDHNSFKTGLIVDKIPNDVQGKVLSALLEKYDIGIVVADTSISVSSNRISAKEILKSITESLGGKGGGNEKIARGKLTRELTIEEIVGVL